MAKHIEHVTTSPLSEKLYCYWILKASESVVRGNLILPNFLTIMLCDYSCYADHFSNLKSALKTTADPSRQLEHVSS